MSVLEKARRCGKAMSLSERSRMKGGAGFSLIELMVVIAIVGVLATLAVPRYNIFRTRARQGEAKANLGVIFSLQETFKIQQEQFYNGVGGAAGWGGAHMRTGNNNDDGFGYANQGVPAGNCQANKLGFRLANCARARYVYMMEMANETEFLAIAHGMSNSSVPASVNEKRIFPGCNGAGAPREPASSGNTVTMRCNRAGTNAERGDGDAWCMDEERNLENYRDIVEYCTDT